MAFLQKYQDTKSLEDLWKKLQDLHQDSLMEYRLYEDMFVKLWDKWEASLGEGEKVPDCLKKDCFLDGLYPLFREKVKGKFPASFEESIALTREKDRKLRYQAQLRG